MNISANLNICTSNPSLRKAPKRYGALAQLPFRQCNIANNGFADWGFVIQIFDCFHSCNSLI